MDQLVNQAAKMRYMFGGRISLPMVLRVPAGAGVSAAAQHSQSLEAWVTHVPGLKVVYPSTPRDALGIMLSAIDDDNPVVFVEHKAMYALKGEVDSLSPIPIGKGDIKRAGSDVTIIATGKMVHESLSAAEILSGEGISCEVLDPRSLYPLDVSLIKDSISKTHRVVIATEEVKRGSYSGEISAIIAEDCFDLLDAPIIRVGALNSPVPFAPCLEGVMLPNSKDVVNAVKKIS
jgi:pyruvate dehydrogenase E1 component beta subunit